jgi:hypothetical protein
MAIILESDFQRDTIRKHTTHTLEDSIAILEPVLNSFTHLILRHNPTDEALYIIFFSLGRSDYMAYFYEVLL